MEKSHHSVDRSQHSVDDNASESGDQPRKKRFNVALPSVSMPNIIPNAIGDAFHDVSLYLFDYI
jgi:hypothetical protein